MSAIHLDLLLPVLLYYYICSWSNHHVPTGPIQSLLVSHLFSLNKSLFGQLSQCLQTRRRVVCVTSKQMFATRMISKEISLARYDPVVNWLSLWAHISLFFRLIKLWRIKQKRMTLSGLRKPLWIGSKNMCPDIWWHY